MNSKILFNVVSLFIAFSVSSYAQTVVTNGDGPTTGNYSTYIGYGAGVPYYGGTSNNTFVGYEAGAGGTSTTRKGGLIFIGRGAGLNLSNDVSCYDNIMIGGYAGNLSYARRANIFIGKYAGKGSTVGYENIILGYYAGQNTEGYYRNIYIGSNAGTGSVKSDYNLFAGYESGAHLGYYTSGIYNKNIFFGYRSGYSSKANNSIFIGESAGQSSNGENNLFLGNGAGSGLAGSNKLIIDNDVDGSGVALIEGDFSSNYFTVNGRIGVNTPTPDAALDVVGTIKAQEIQVTLASMEDLQLNGTLAANNITYTANGNTADHVFEEDYNLKSLAEIESFIKENKHLPDVPSAYEMEEKGVNLAEMNKLLLQKVEELTLHLIEKDKEVESLKEKMNKIEELLNQNK